MSVTTLGLFALAMVGCQSPPPPSGMLSDGEACVRLSAAVREQSEAVADGDWSASTRMLSAMREIGEATPTELGTAMAKWAEEAEIARRSADPVVDATGFAPIRARCIELGADWPTLPTR